MSKLNYFFPLMLICPLVSCNSNSNVTLTDINVTCNKQTYSVDSKINKSDFKVTANYSNNETKDINVSDCNFNVFAEGSDEYTFTFSDVGNKNFQISYQNKSKTVIINVLDYSGHVNESTWNEDINNLTTVSSNDNFSFLKDTIVNGEKTSNLSMSVYGLTSYISTVNEGLTSNVIEFKDDNKVYCTVDEDGNNYAVNFENNTNYSTRVNSINSAISPLQNNYKKFIFNKDSLEFIYDPQDSTYIYKVKFNNENKISYIHFVKDELNGINYSLIYGK